MRALIVANGDITAWERTPPDRLTADLVVAVDGGWLHCQTLGVNADVVIGDFDSLPGMILQQLQGTDTLLIQHPREKDEIDLELALIYALEQGARTMTILGGLGGRFDMTLANVSLLFHPRLQGLPIEFWHQGQKLWLILPPGDEIPGETGDTLSLLPFGGEASGIRTTNLAYPLENERLPLGFSRGLSNLLTANTANVSLESGALLAVLTHGRA
ncbi:MAG: thiamine diphosphokinase [Anaerolineales bacterium]|nr:MAG: thiamine diphosphokinase [Anaerolineales bacterium]